MEDEEKFFLSIYWEAQADIEDYLRSSSGMALLGAIDLLSEKSAVKTSHEARWKGIDVLKRMRKKTEAPPRDKGSEGEPLVRAHRECRLPGAAAPDN